MKLISCSTASINFKVLGIYNFGAASVADGGRQWAQQAEKGGGMAASGGGAALGAAAPTSLCECPT